MSMWKLDYDKVYSQVQVNTSLRRLEWTSNKLKDNIFEVIAIISKHRDLQMKGNPYLIKKSKREIRNQIWAWDFDYKGNPSRR